jgi:hypothetical protein
MSSVGATSERALTLLVLVRRLQVLHNEGFAYCCMLQETVPCRKLEKSFPAMVLTACATRGNGKSNKKAAGPFGTAAFVFWW